MLIIIIQYITIILGLKGYHPRHLMAPRTTFSLLVSLSRMILILAREREGERERKGEERGRCSHTFLLDCGTEVSGDGRGEGI